MSVQPPDISKPKTSIFLMPKDYQQNELQNIRLRAAVSKINLTENLNKIYKGMDTFDDLSTKQIQHLKTKYQARLLVDMWLKDSRSESDPKKSVKNNYQASMYS